MKRLILSLITLISITTFGQAPEAFKYQSIIRDGANLILNNQAVGIRMTIQQGNIGGTTVYQETFAPTTNSYGLVNLEIGRGTITNGDFTSINWAAGPFFIETAVDITGGTSFVIMGTSQLLSVPYALHAKTAESVTNTCGLSLGDSYQGGIIFYLDPSGCHGLISASTDQSFDEGIQDGGAYGSGLFEGKCNTDKGCQALADPTMAARICQDLILGGYSDWFLPSIEELNKMYQNIGPGNNLGLGNIGGFANSFYWSSTEVDGYTAWVQNFIDGNKSMIDKTLNHNVRAARAF